MRRTALIVAVAVMLLPALVPARFAAAAGSAAPAATPAPAASASPAPRVLNGRLLDMQNGFAFFTSGDTFRIAPGTVVRLEGGNAAFTGDDVAGYYAKTTFAPGGAIVAMTLTRKPLPLDDLSTLRSFAVALSTPYSNPDLGNGAGFTGEPVLVSFTVQVPPTTPLTDAVYISTEASQWDPMEIRMDRIDSLHYRITRRINSGTHLVYRYTRGTWRASERGRDGIEGAPRVFLIRNLDLARRDDVVYHWSDESADGTTAVGPDSIPTPFSNNPFSVPSPGTHF